MNKDTSSLVFSCAVLFFLYSYWSFIWGCLALYGSYNVFIKVDNFQSFIEDKLKIKIPDFIKEKLELTSNEDIDVSY